jgi:hypothetical protein
MGMNKILVVVVLGGIALALFLALQGRGSNAPAANAVTSATQSQQAASAQSQQVSPQASVAAVQTAAPHTDSATCARLADLCSTSNGRMDTAGCEQQLADARKLAGDGNMARTEQCLVDAKTCAAAQGCISGGVGMGAMGEFLKGLGSAMSH